MNTVQQEGSYFWSGGLTAVKQHTYIPYSFSQSNISPFLLFFQQAYSNQDTHDSQVVPTPQNLLLTNGRDTRKKTIMWCLRTAPPLDHHFLPWPRKLRETLSSQSQWAYWYHHIQKARWFWRLLCCSLGFHSFHFMPNCNRPSICILIFYVW